MASSAFPADRTLSKRTVKLLKDSWENLPDFALPNVPLKAWHDGLSFSPSLPAPVSHSLDLSVDMTQILAECTADHFPSRQAFLMDFEMPSFTLLSQPSVVVRGRLLYLALVMVVHVARASQLLDESAAGTMLPSVHGAAKEAAADARLLLEQLGAPADELDLASHAEQFGGYVIARLCHGDVAAATSLDFSGFAARAIARGRVLFDTAFARASAASAAAGAESHWTLDTASLDACFGFSAKGAVPTRLPCEDARYAPVHAMASALLALAGASTGATPLPSGLVCSYAFLQEE